MQSPLRYNTVEVIKLNYSKNAQVTAYRCLIDCGVTSLPIRPVQIAERYGIACRRSNRVDLCGSLGEIKVMGGEVCIFTDESHTNECRRFTIMHELGHFLLGHLGGTPLLLRTGCDGKPEEELAADRFAEHTLMPVCILRELNISAPGDVARICCVSMHAASVSVEHMQQNVHTCDDCLLRSLEERIHAQFSGFLNRYRELKRINNNTSPQVR